MSSLFFIIPLGSSLIDLGTVSLSTDFSQNCSRSPQVALKASSLFLLFLSIVFTVILNSSQPAELFSHGSFILKNSFHAVEPGNLSFNLVLQSYGPILK